MTMAYTQVLPSDSLFNYLPPFKVLATLSVIVLVSPLCECHQTLSSPCQMSLSTSTKQNYVLRLKCVPKLTGSSSYILKILDCIFDMSLFTFRVSISISMDEEMLPQVYFKILCMMVQ